MRSIKALYEGGRARVKVEGMESKWFCSAQRSKARMYTVAMAF